jgi:predicted permease
MMETLWQDLRYGMRTLRRNPGFTLIALLSLGLGIGANTAIFSLIDVMMLKSMPVQRPEELALLTVYQLDRDPALSFSFPLVERFQANKEAFSGVMASGGGGRMHMTVSGSGDQSELVRPDRVTGDFFDVLGINPVLGRVFTEDDDRKYDAHAVAVISYNFWKRRFALDPGVIGKQITLNDFPFMIIGVTPPGFTGMEVGGNPDIWFPLWMVDQFPDAIPNRANSNMVQTGSWWLRVIGRLKPGVTLASAQSEMDVILQQMLTEMAETRSKNPFPWTTTERNRFFARRIILQPGGAGFSFLRFRFAKPLYILMTIVGLVLLIACANVANLLLARAAMRQKEIGVRLAIGAGRLRLIRQLLTESVLLAVLGGALGLALSKVFTGLLVAYLTAQQTSLTLDLSPNAHILGFTFAVSVLTGILFGLAPALRATGFDLVPALKETTGNLRMGMSRVAIDKVLVVAQVALSLFLLIGAGLFVRTLQKLRNVDAGFDAEKLLVFTLDTNPSYKIEQRMNLTRQVLARLETLPGAHSATVTGFTMLSGNSSTTNISVTGFSPTPDDNLSCHVLDTGPRYFETMGIPVLVGRDFNSSDDHNPAQPVPAQPNASSTPKPVIINQTMAAFFWRDDSAVGKRFTSNNVDYEIIGVVKDAKYENLREKVDRAFYRPFFFSSFYPGSTFMLRTFSNPIAATTAVQQVVSALDKDAQVLDVRTMENVVDASLVQERFISQLASFFSLFALLLACLGLYGIMSHGVVRRTREMGIRMALGAQSTGVVWLVMRQSLVLVVIGIIVGVPAALLAARYVSNFLFGLSPTDPVTITISTCVLLSVAVMAGYLPARRASRIDPMLALRYE